MYNSSIWFGIEIILALYVSTFDLIVIEKYFW